MVSMEEEAAREEAAAGEKVTGMEGEEESP